MKFGSLTVILIYLCATSNPAIAQWDYHDYSSLVKKLQQIEQNNLELCKLSSIGKSAGGRDIWVLKIKKGEETKPSILIVAGADGHHRAGVEIALGLLEERLNKPELIEKCNFYFIPGLSPDALVPIGTKIITKCTNDNTVDDDRDGLADEDPAEDLNKDGLITWIRVAHPAGDYVKDTKDPRLMVKLKGETTDKQRYLLYQEGIDNDNDNKFNEDSQGGVNIDMNFAFDYPFGKAGAGYYAASEPETRALMDFLATHQEIFAVLHLGPSDNLVEPPTYQKQQGESKIITSVTETDAQVYKSISEEYKKLVGYSRKIANAPDSGSLSQTLYFHAGRWSFVSPGWFPVSKSMTKDSLDNKQINGNFPLNHNKNGRIVDKINNDASLLKWADESKVELAFIPWQPIDHPNFSNYKVEVGGVNTAFHLNPPSIFLDSAIIKHNAFLTKMASLCPHLQLVNEKIEKLNEGLFRITIEFFNSGLFPTNTEIADKLKVNSKLKVKIYTDNNQKLISGNKVTFLKAMQSGERKEMSWLVSGSGECKIEIGSDTTNKIVKKINLK